MALSNGLKTASYLLRLDPEDKRRLEERAAEQEMTLADALRDGAYRLLEERRQEREHDLVLDG